MDRTQLWGRRLLSGAFVVLAALGFRSVAAGEAGGLLAGMSGVRPDGCAVGELAVGYVVDYASEIGGYEVTGARISGAAACAGRKVSVTFTGADGGALGHASGLLARPSTTVLLDEPATVTAAEVGGVAVVLLG